MIGSIIILIVAIIIFVICLLCANDDGIFVFIGGLSLTLAALMVTGILESKSPIPTTLDVYRGKTTLEITYRDSVAIDSTVVYKMK